MSPNLVWGDFVDVPIAKFYFNPLYFQATGVHTTHYVPYKLTTYLLTKSG